jgi:hypothetical protein
MSSQRIIGLIALIAGVILIGFAMYIKQEVVSGNAQIARGEQKINTTEKVFSLTPTTKQLGSGFTKSGKEQIAKGKEEIAYYTNLANKLQITGIILLIVGGGILIFGKKRR